MPLILIPPRASVSDPYTREIVVPATPGETPEIHRIIAMSDKQMGFAFFDGIPADPATKPLCDGSVVWGNPMGGVLELDGRDQELVVGTVSRPIYAENRTSGFLTIFVA